MAGETNATKEEKLETSRGSSAIREEGGWGWMIVVGCFFATICTRAVTRCVSVFFVEFQIHFEKDYSSTAWILSLIDSTTMLCAPLGAFLGNYLSCRAIVMLGGLLSAAGLVISSFASNLEHLYIFLGIMTGLGFALSYTPSVAMVGRYFSEKKALAYGISLSGTGIGTFILPPVVQILIDYYSWRGAILILGGFVSILCVCGALMRPLEQRVCKRMWENNLASLEEDPCLIAAPESKELKKQPPDYSHQEPKQLESTKLNYMQGLVIQNEALQICALENNKQRNIALAAALTDPTLTDLKLSECVLFSNKLTAPVLNPKQTNGQTVEDLNLENLALNNKVDLIIDTDIDGSKPQTEVQTSDASDLMSDESISPPPVPEANTEHSPRVPCCFLTSREQFSFLTKPDFLTLSVSFLFLAYACSSPLVYLFPYAVSQGLEHKQAALLMSIVGVSGIVGNISFGWVTDRKVLKRYRLISHMVAVGMEGLCCMFLPLLNSFPLLALFCVLYGYFDGAYVALIPVVTSEVAGSTYLTSALGVVYFLHAIPYLVSAPIGGWLVDKTGNYTATFFLSGASFICSSAIVAAAPVFRWAKSRKAEVLCPNNNIDGSRGDVI